MNRHASTVAGNRENSVTRGSGCAAAERSGLREQQATRHGRPLDSNGTATAVLHSRGDRWPTRGCLRGGAGYRCVLVSAVRASDRHMLAQATVASDLPSDHGGPDLLV